MRQIIGILLLCPSMAWAALNFPAQHPENALRYEWKYFSALIDVYFWRENGLPYLEVVPKTGEFFLCAFQAIQDGAQFDVHLVDKNVNGFCGDVLIRQVLQVSAYSSNSGFDKYKDFIIVNDSNRLDTAATYVAPTPIPTPTPTPMPTETPTPSATIPSLRVTGFNISRATCKQGNRRSKAQFNGVAFQCGQPLKLGKKVTITLIGTP